MLTAITRGKAGRVRLPGSEFDLSWRDVFRAREDLLTAVFFGRMRYLSDTALLRAMRSLIGESADELGAFVDSEFWPRLEQLKGRAWVEPDVLLKFEHALVMVEVKPPFGGEQSVAQWQAEVDALLAELRGDASWEAPVVHFVALGRTSRVRADALAEFDTEDLFDLHVHCVEWQDLALPLSDWAAGSARSDAAVFEDWISAFELFGIQVRRPREWKPLADWAEGHSVAVELLHQWPAGRAVVPPAPQATPGWAALLDFTDRYPMELEPWH
jgi:hypothetical protein